MADPASIISKLTKLRPTDVPLDQPLSSGVVSLYEDPNWRSRNYNIELQKHGQGDREILPRGSLDNTTWVAWNLPVGTVVTLTDHYKSRGSDTVGIGDLKDLGGSVDLVGTGTTETTDLRNCNMNDLVASFFWRTVNLSFGAFEMFEHPNFTGVRNTIFLSEWEPNRKYALPGWHMNDNMSSIRWGALPEQTSVILHADPQGGDSYRRCMGRVSEKEDEFVDKWGFNDKVSAFEWTTVLPRKEILDPVQFHMEGIDTSHGFESKAQFTNNTDTDQEFQVSLEKTTSETLTVSTTSTHAWGVTAKVEATFGGGAGGVAKAEITVGLELRYDYTLSKTKERSTSTEIKVATSQNITAQPHGTTYATLFVVIARIGETQFATRAQRWYDIELPGCVRDDGNPSAPWKREETAYFNVSGGMAVSSVARADFQP